MSMHVPARPSWACAGCGLAWPCPDSRQQLTIEYADARVSLSIYLATNMVEAMTDLPAGHGGDLRWRFLGWL